MAAWVRLCKLLQHISVPLGISLMTLTLNRCNGEVDFKNYTKAAALIDRILNQSDSRVRPQVYGPPVKVYCDLFVINIGSVNAINMDFQMDLYFRQKWHDPRLAFTEQEAPVIMGPKLIEKIWTPDLFFPNEKSAEIHDVMLKNQVVKVFPNGTLRVSTRMTLKLSCPMVLTHFPMDHQRCYIKISSYAYTEDDLILTWEDNDPVELNQDELYLPQFELKHTNTDRCVALYKTGNFSCLMAMFNFRRQFGYYLLQAYIPSMLIVIISWISFWIHKNAVPARITLGVTTVLTMATQLQTASAHIVSYARALDVWYAGCMILVFSVLIEYAVVNSLTRIEAEQEAEDEEEVTAEQNGQDLELRMLSTATEAKGVSVHLRKTKKRRWQITSDGLDKTSRTLFPLTFIVFNFCYWIIYSKETIFVIIDQTFH